VAEASRLLISCRALLALFAALIVALLSRLLVGINVTLLVLSRLAALTGLARLSRLAALLTLAVLALLTALLFLLTRLTALILIHIVCHKKSSIFRRGMLPCAAGIIRHLLISCVCLLEG
jgi:hypothetical protein